jgi:hypothetical protein
MVRGAKRWLDRWVTPGAQKMLVGMAVCLPILGCLVTMCARLGSDGPPYTKLAPYALTPDGPVALRFELSVDRDAVLYVTRPAPWTGTFPQRVTLNLHRWEHGTRRDTLVGRITEPAADSSYSGPPIVAATDGGFYMWVSDGVARVTPEGQLETYANPHYDLRAEDVRAIARAYGAAPARPIARVEWPSRDPNQPLRTYFFNAEGRSLALCCLTEHPLVVENWRGAIARATLDNPILEVSAPPNPTFVEGAFHDYKGGAPLTSAAEGLRIERRCYGRVYRCGGTKYIATVQGRRFVIPGRDYISHDVLLPRSRYLTMRDGTLLWIHEGTLYALR